MRAPVPPLRIHNPGLLQSDEDVTRLFAARSAERTITLNVLRDNIGAPSCQHTLLIGPAGAGKTMLLARVAADLRTDPALCARLLPVRLPEDPDEVASLADLWLETLLALAREIAPSDPAHASELRAAHAALLHEQEGAEREDYALSCILKTAERLGRQLVLIVERLHDVLRAIGAEPGAWRLRRTLQGEPSIIMLASAPHRFQEIEDYSYALYSTYRTLTLGPLDTAACRRLWQAVTDENITETAIRPLEILTAGNARLLAIAAHDAHRDPGRSLTETVVALVDRHTPRLRASLAKLAKTERRVYAAALDLWRPSTSREIARRARIDIRIASTMLGRLAGKGALDVDDAGRHRTYAAAAPLHALAYRLRREGEHATDVRHLLDLMEAFYGAGDEPAQDLIERKLAKCTSETAHAPREVRAVTADVAERLRAADTA